MKNNVTVDKSLLKVIKQPISRVEQGKILKQHPASVSHKAIALGFRRLKHSPRVKLNERDKLELQQRFLNGESLKMLKDKFKVSYATIYKIGYSS